MGNRNLWVFMVIIILLILFYIIVPETDNIEGFKPRDTHAKLDGDGKVIYYSQQSPSQNGENGCAVVPCPKYIDDSVTCWCCCNF